MRTIWTASIASIIVSVFALTAFATEGDGSEHVFDHHVVLGEIFCDDDGDGRRGESELGIGGVRVASDEGFEVRSDLNGRYHLRGRKAGNHLFKVDSATLPPGAMLLDAEKRVFYFTTGRMERFDLPLKCAYGNVKAERVTVSAKAEAKTEGQTETKELSDTPLTTVVGSLDPLKVYVDGQLLPRITAFLGVKVGQGKRAYRRVNVPWRPGFTDNELVFTLSAKVDKPVGAGMNWRLVISRSTDLGESVIREFFGRGKPAKTLSWDGTDASGMLTLLERGGLYRARLHVSDGGGMNAVSTAASFGINYGVTEAALEHRVLRGELYDDKKEPTETFIEMLYELEDIVSSNEGCQVLLEVHTDDTAITESSLDQSRKAAYLLAQATREEFDLEEDQVRGLGYGSTQPLVPNINANNQARNRRVEITILPAPQKEKMLAVPGLRAKPGAMVNGHALIPRADGSFLKTLERPEDGYLALQFQTAKGVTYHGLLSLGTESGKKGTRSLQERAMAQFGGPPLDGALGQPVPEGTGNAPLHTAEQLEVLLPPVDSPVMTTQLFVSGTSHPENRVTINGNAVMVSDDGRFAALVALPSGESTLHILSEDAAGKKAEIVRSISVNDKEFFVLALADGAGGELGAYLPGRGSTTSGEVGPIFLQGRGAVYFKGRVSGSVLAKDLFITAQVDSSQWKNFGGFQNLMIDPQRTYAIFGDNAEDQSVVDARGPLFVVVEADKSVAAVGNLRLGTDGVELLRYDRALYGGLIDFKRAFAPGWDTQVKGFFSEDISRVRRGHDEIRATGGSVYYLSSRSVLEGTERVTVVVRERDTRIELSRSEMVRQRDYRIDYYDGRIFLKTPLSSVADSMWSLSRFQLQTGRQPLSGHEVWLHVVYETEDPTSDGEVVGGVQARQRIFDMAEVGGGYIREQRKGASYEVYGADVVVDLGEDNRITAEFAGSKGIDGTSQFSTNGGVSYSDASRAGIHDEGWAYKIGLDSRPGKLFGIDLGLRVRGWWDFTDPGFHALGRSRDQGTERYGAEASYRPTDDDLVMLRFDGQTVLVPDVRFIEGLRTVRRFRYGARYERQLGAFRLDIEAAFGQHRDDLDGQAWETGGALAGLHYRVSDKLTLSLIQEALIGGESRLLGEDIFSRMSTRIGMSWRLSDELTLALGNEFRWDGDNAIRVGLRTRLDDGTETYLEQRVLRRDSGGGVVQSTVLGADKTLENGTRTYGEYHMDGGVTGQTNRAVLGIGRSFEVSKGVRLSGIYERSQSFGGLEGTGSRDVFSGGFELLALDWLKFGGRYELRIDHRDSEGIEPTESSVTAPTELVQAAIQNGLTLKLAKDLTGMIQVNYILTQNLANRDIERKSLVANLALVYRPRALDWLTIFGRYSRYQLMNLAVSGVGFDDPSTYDREATDLISMTAQMKLPYRMRLTEKMVFRHQDMSLQEMAGPSIADELLWVTRFGIRIIADLYGATEYRLFADLGDLSISHGALVEVSYDILGYGRVGLGYDFTDIPRDLEPGITAERGGAYLRITGTY